MRTIAHLSDLHFGRIDETILDPLRQHLEELRPHVVVVSGDLTQRARRREFRDARAYLDTLPKPQIVVPGNHDVPLYDVVRRFARPLHRYRRYITDDLSPLFVDDEIAVIGVNTARSLTFKGGRINEEQVEHVRRTLCGLDDVVKVVVTHHPFDLPDKWDPAHVVGRAPMAMQALAACGADILLAGHLHLAHMGETTARVEVDGYAALLVQAGTATSTRGRGEANSFNVLRVSREKIEIEHRAWNDETRRFGTFQQESFSHTGRGWARVAARAT